MVIVSYVLLGLVAAAAFLLFVAGRFIGGVLDDTKADADGNRPPLPNDAGYLAKFGRWINESADNAQRAAGTILIAVALIALAMSGLRWYKLDKDGIVFVLSAVTAGIMFFYLSANDEEKKARGIQASWLLSIAWVGFILINALLANNAEWFPVQIKEITVAERKELVIPTPTGTILSVPEILGPAWETYLTDKKDVLKPELALNLATGGFDMRWSKEVGRYEMRSNRIAFRTELARGEYRRAEDIRLTQKALSLDVRETDIIQSKRAERLEKGKVPLISRFSTKEIVFLVAVLLVALSLLAYGHEEKKDDKKPADPKPAAPKAA